MMSYIAAARRCALVAVAAMLVLVGGAASAAARTSTLSEPDRAFLIGAHQSNLAEIAAGKLAQSKARNAEVKDLGAMLVADHTKLDAALRKVAAAAQVSLPTVPNAEQRAVQAQLMQASGDEFDALFVAGQLTGHAKAIGVDPVRRTGLV